MLVKRIMVIGRSGSGKSTFAWQLHKATKIPVYHLDKFFFTDFWIEQDYQQFLKIQEVLVNQDTWIIDGNSTKSFEMRYQRAQCCLYFNFPRYLCYWRVFKRLFYKDACIEDRANNCPETVRWSLLKYMWGFEKRVDPILSRLKNNYPTVNFIEIRSDRQLKKLLKDFGWA